MRRREFLGAVGSAALAWPLAVRAQQSGTLPLIAYLDGSGLPRWFEAFQKGLSDFGYVQGRTITIDRRSAGGRTDRLLELAKEFVRLDPKIIVASGTPAAAAARNATRVIPIVFTFATDPIDAGLVASLARPGGNVTGQSNQGPGLVGKRLQLLAEMLPGVSHFGVVWTPYVTSNNVDFREMRAAAAELNLTLDSFEVTGPGDFDAVFRQAASRLRGVAVLSGPLIFSHRDLVVATAARYKMPAIYYDDEYAKAGGLFSYGPSLLGLHRSSAVFVDKILKGARPADLPVEQPTRFNLVLNMKVAKALGIDVPPSILVRADEVIE